MTWWLWMILGVALGVAAVYITLVVTFMGWMR